MPTEYTKTVTFTGHPAKDLDAARTTFMNQGFQIVANSNDELRVTGPERHKGKSVEGRGRSLYYDSRFRDRD